MKQLLNDMALFTEVVRSMSFHRAAELMNIPSSTLSRRISMLEKSIGLRLLNRTTRKIELTEAGLIYFERCQHIIDEANLVHKQLKNMLIQPSGILKISLPTDFAITYLAPLIVIFSKKYPDIYLDLDTTPRRVDLVGEPFDIAIRIGELEDSHLIARLLTKMPTYLYASPEYLKQYGVPDQPNELINHKCMHILKSDTWLLQNEGNVSQVAINNQISINSIGLIKQLASLGMGIVLLPEKVVADDLSKGTLKRILPQWVGSSIPVYALTESHLIPAKAQLFIDSLHDYFK